MIAFGIDLGSTNTKVAVVRVRDDEAHAELVLSLPTPSHGAAVRANILALLAEALAAGEPFLLDVPMRNIPTPTSGHWNILDIYSPEGVKGHATTD